jgi:hypothetical protein
MFEERREIPDIGQQVEKKGLDGPRIYRRLAVLEKKKTK